MDSWKILVVDDEPDIHTVTKIALKRVKWRGAPIAVTSAKSAKEARDILEGGERFDVALVDVVMEAEDAGLRFCEHLRETQPRSTRIILRTGQPGSAPEESVFNDYDIDQYLAKPDATASRLLGAIKSCLRVSSEMATIEALMTQAEHLSLVLRKRGTNPEFLAVAKRSLAALSKKYGLGFVFVADSELHAEEDALLENVAADETSEPNLVHLVAIRTTREGGAESSRLHSCDSLGPNWYVMTATRPGTSDLLVDRDGDAHAESGEYPFGGVCVRVPPQHMAKLEFRNLERDLALFLRGLMLGYRVLVDQRRIPPEAKASKAPNLDAQALLS